MAQEENKEFDLNVLFDSLKRGLKKLLAYMYRGVRFLVKKAWILLILIVIGVVTGLILQKALDGKKSATVVLRANMGSSTYLYEAVQNLDNKLQNKDTLFFKKLGISIDKDPILSITVKPVVDVGDILDDYKNYNNEQVLTLLDQINAKDDFLEQETFRNTYVYHYLTIEISQDASEKVLDKLMTFLEDNPFFQKIREANVRNLKTRLLNNNFTLTEIDSLLVNTNKALVSGNKGGNGQLLLLNEGMDISQVLGTKRQLIADNTEIEDQILKRQKLFYIVNKPDFVHNKTIMDKKYILAPILFVVLFILFHTFAKVFSKAKKYAGDLQ